MKTYLVGGAVRDSLMGLEPKDRDYVVVGASPQEMTALGFSQVGADFPVFLHPQTGEEYALARTERKTGDGYHGFAVHYDEDVTLEDDLCRRDLTINSMAMGEDGKLHDPFGGQADLDNKVLRHTSSAFKDDPLRVVRLCRFAARMPAFSIADITYLFAQNMVQGGELNHLPYERFAAEIVKVLETCSPEGCVRFFDLLGQLGAEKHIDFFKGLSCSRMGAAAAYCVQHLTGDYRLQVFAALARGHQHLAVLTGGSEGLLLSQLLEHNLNSPLDASSLLTQLKRVGWQNHERLCRYARAVEAFERSMGTRVTFDRALLVTAFNVLAPVSSQLAPTLMEAGLTGSELGKAINAERQKLAECLLQPA
jgi:tRNA nucleotidyltransferase (CCA-adding enzyme)